MTPKKLLESMVWFREAASTLGVDLQAYRQHDDNKGLALYADALECIILMGTVLEAQICPECRGECRD